MNSLIFPALRRAIICCLLLLLLLPLGNTDTRTLSEHVAMDNMRASDTASWLNPKGLGNPLLADMLVAYFRYHGVACLMLVVCEQDIATPHGQRQLAALTQHFMANDFFVEISNEATFTDLSLQPNITVEFAPPSTFRTDNETRQPLSLVVPHLTSKLGVIMLHINSPCALNLLRWCAATENNYFTTGRFWLLLTGNEEDIALLDEDEDIFLPPDSEARVWLINANETSYTLIDVYKVVATSRLKQSIIGERMRSIEQLINALKEFGSPISYRYNLEGTQFNTGIVIAFPDVFINIEDLSLRHIDTISKINHHIMLELANKMNISFNTYQTDNYGWLKGNGTFDGLMGRFQRYELDFAQLAIFMRTERIAVCDFVAETYRIRAGIMFRQPPLSAVSNIFVLPFHLDVWLSVIAIVIITVVVLLLELFFSPQTHDMSYIDCLNFVWGAMCQQGFYVEVRNRSARIIVFTTFVASVFLFTSFSANIVALLQSPSDAIRTLADLGQSPLEIGVQDTQYNKIYFTESTDPVTQNLYHKKIAYKGDTAYMRPAIGMEKLRTGLFAYQVEIQAGYQVVSDTFSEPEKCGLMEIEPFQLPMLSIPTRKNFPYKELFRRQIRWQREVGLVNHEAAKWFPQKPKCETGFGGFVSIGLTECRYALAIFGWGLLVSFIFFLFELLFKRYYGRIRNVQDLDYY